MITDQQGQSGSVLHFRNSLTKVVDLGYGDDECEFVVSVMFDELIRQVVPERDRRKLSFAKSLQHGRSPATYAQLHTRAEEVARLVEQNASARDARPGRSPVLFPFMTTLGIAGGVFLLACHISRLTPIMF